MQVDRMVKILGRRGKSVEFPVTLEKMSDSKAGIAPMFVLYSCTNVRSLPTAHPATLHSTWCGLYCYM